jgi:type II secretory pathway pseudopilin PulG
MIKRKNRRSKKAFSMVTAIFVIVMMASLTALIMNISGRTIKSTTMQYQKEQAGLLARSYTELALLYVIHYDRTATPSCLETITDHFGEAGDEGYDIRINIKYIGNDTLLDGCDKTILTDGSVGTASDVSNIATWSEETTGFDKTISLIIDTFITYRDFDDPAHQDITYHRRTLQKI